MKNWKNKWNTRRWEIKIVMLALLMTVMVTVFIRTYERFVIPAVTEVPKEFSVNDTNEDAVRISLKAGKVSQTLTADYNGLSAFGIKFAVSGRPTVVEDSQVLIQFRDLEDSKLIQENRIPVTEIEDLQFHKILLNKELVGAVGHSYQIEISLVGKAEVFLPVSGEDVYVYGKCYQNGRLLKGDIGFSLFGSSYDFLKGAYYLVGILFIISVMLLFGYLAFWKDIKLENVFLIASLIFGIIYSIVLPPFATPDESAHFISSYNISKHILGEEVLDNEERETQDPYGNDGYFNRYTNINTYRYVYNSLHSSDKGFLAFYDKQYNYIEGKFLFGGHFVQAAAITLGRLADLNYMQMVYFARLINLIFYCIINYLAIKTIPIGKLFMLCISFLPMIFELSSSVSYDGWVLSFGFLYIAYCLKCIYVKEKVSLKDMLLLFALLFLCTNFKYVYYVMGGILLLIPWNKYKNKKQIYVLFGICAALFLVLAGKTVIERSKPLTAEQIEQAELEEKVVGSVRGQTYLLSDLLRHPKTLFTVYINTARDSFGVYLGQMIGGSLGSLNVSVNSLYIYLLLLLLFVAALPMAKEKITVSRNQGIVYAFIFGGVAAAILLSMFVAWTGISSDTIEGVQGRYFLPILPLVCLMIQKLPIKIERDISKKIICMMLLINYFVVLDAFEFCIKQSI